MTRTLRRVLTDLEDSAAETQDAVAELIIKYLAELSDRDSYSLPYGASMS